MGAALSAMVAGGQIAAHEPADALILVAIADTRSATGSPAAPRRVARAGPEIGPSVLGVLSAAYDQALPQDLTPAGRTVIELPDPEVLDPRLAGLMAGAGALQALRLQPAHARRVNPDLIRREQGPYRRAAHAAEGSPKHLGVAPHPRSPFSRATEKTPKGRPFPAD